MSKVVNTNSLALHLKKVLDKAIQSDSGVLKFISYQIHKNNNVVTLSSHIVTSRNGVLYLHAMSYVNGLFKVTTFISGKGAVNNSLSESADKYLTDVYLAGNTGGLDLYCAYIEEEGYIFSTPTSINLGCLYVPSKPNPKYKNYYIAITQSLTYMLRANIQRLRMLGVKKYTLGSVLDADGIKKEFGDATLDVFVVRKQRGFYSEISLGFTSKGTLYKLEYLPNDTPKCDSPISITVSRYNDDGEEELYEVTNLSKSYIDVLISFVEYLEKVFELIYGKNSENHYYAIDLISHYNPYIRL